MIPSAVVDAPRVSWRLVRPLLGSLVTVRTVSRTLQGTLLSCVRGSAWLVVDDLDVVVDLDDIVSIHPT
jgi:hypothetical protein